MPAIAPRSILVICMRRLGDVLLCTPLIASLRRAWPQARIDALVAAADRVAVTAVIAIKGAFAGHGGGE